MDDLKTAVEQAVLRAREARTEAALLRKQCEENRAIAAKTLQAFRCALAELRGFPAERLAGNK